MRLRAVEVIINVTLVCIVKESFGNTGLFHVCFLRGHVWMWMIARNPWGTVYITQRWRRWRHLPESWSFPLRFYVRYPKWNWTQLDQKARWKRHSTGKVLRSCHLKWASTCWRLIWWLSDVYLVRLFPGRWTHREARHAAGDTVLSGHPFMSEQICLGVIVSHRCTVAVRLYCETTGPVRI